MNLNDPEAVEKYRNEMSAERVRTRAHAVEALTAWIDAEANSSALAIALLPHDSDFDEVLRAVTESGDKVVADARALLHEAFSVASV